MKAIKIVPFGLAMSCALMTGCATTPYQNAAVVKATRPDKAVMPVATRNMPLVVDISAAPDKAVANLTPLSAYQDEWESGTPEGKDFPGSYTRLLIHSTLKADGEGADSAINVPYKKRAWLSRALVGKEFSVNLTANITVGAFESTVPLATIGHQSDTEGEKWSRVIHHSTLNFPLFLVKTDGSASVPVVKVSVNGTKSYSSRGAAAAVQVALGVARATGQAAPVVTRLSEQSAKDKARAIDDAISKLFASAITEEHWTDRDLRYWRTSSVNEPQGVRVTFKIPSGENNWDSPLQEVGSWIITFDYPRPSIFSDWRICKDDTLPRCTKNRVEAEKNVHKEINTGQVLNYILLNGDQVLGTIRAFLSQQDWYISAQAGFATPALVNATATTFCKRITNEITGLGLNGFDAEIVVWAVVNGMPLPGNAKFSVIEGCKNSIAAVENDRK